MSRPELQRPPELYYDEAEALKYTNRKRNIKVQREMADRCVNIMDLDPKNAAPLVLDLGCGSGLSGESLSDSRIEWVGVDISPAMLEIALVRDVEGDLFLSDLGHGVYFRPGIFDGAISVSALQWMCNADYSHHVPKERLKKMFTTLFSALRPGARAVFQFYPSDSHQLEMLTESAVRSGFKAGVVVDFPNSTKSKKYYLVCDVGIKKYHRNVEPLQATEESVKVEKEKFYRRGKKRKRDVGKETVREWVKRKKLLRRKRGQEVKNDSKYSGRRRSKTWK